MGLSNSKYKRLILKNNVRVIWGKKGKPSSVYAKSIWDSEKKKVSSV